MGKPVEDIIADSTREREARVTRTKDEILGGLTRHPDGSLTGASVARLFMALFEKHARDGWYKATVTRPEIGKLRAFLKRCGPEGEAALCTVMADWLGFTKFAEKYAGAFKSPLMPTVSYLLHFAEAAVNFHRERAPHSSAPTTEKPTETGVTVTPVTPKTHPPVSTDRSAEEIAERKAATKALLDQLNNLDA